MKCPLQNCFCFSYSVLKCFQDFFQYWICNFKTESCQIWHWLGLSKNWSHIQIIPHQNYEPLKNNCNLHSLRDLYANHPQLIINQHFGYSSILRNLEGRNNHFYCQEAILKPKNHQNRTKRFQNIYANHPKMIVNQHFGFS